MYAAFFRPFTIANEKSPRSEAFPRVVYDYTEWVEFVKKYEGKMESAFEPARIREKMLQELSHAGLDSTVVY